MEDRGDVWGDIVVLFHSGPSLASKRSPWNCAPVMRCVAGFAKSTVHALSIECIPTGLKSIHRFSEFPLACLGVGLGMEIWLWHTPLTEGHLDLEELNLAPFDLAFVVGPYTEMLSLDNGVNVTDLFGMVVGGARNGESVFGWPDEPMNGCMALRCPCGSRILHSNEHLLLLSLTCNVGHAICCFVPTNTRAWRTVMKPRLHPTSPSKPILKGEPCLKRTWSNALIIGVRTYQILIVQEVCVVSHSQSRAVPALACTNAFVNANEPYRRIIKRQKS